MRYGFAFGLAPGGIVPINWWEAGGSEMPLAYDATREEGTTLDGSSDVATIVNLGTASSSDLSSTGATNSPLTATVGGNAVEFDGGGTYQPYEGAAAWAATLFDSDKSSFQISGVVQTTITGDQVALSIGADGSGSPRHNLVYNGNGVRVDNEYHDGTTLRRPSQGSTPTSRVINEVSLTASWHNGTDTVLTWQNGIIIDFDSAEANMAAANTNPATDIVALGGLANGVFDMKGLVLLAGAANNGMTLESAHAKYVAAYSQLGLTSTPAFAISVLGQSNAVADFANADPFDFAAGEAFYRVKTGSEVGVFDRTGFGHSTPALGESNPGIYFADEWKILTGEVPLFQELAFSGQPITPGLTGKANYWAPQNAEGDAAGDISLMTQWANDFKRFSELVSYSVEFQVNRNIAFILEGEADAAGFTAGDNVTQARLEGFITDWLDDLVSLYGFDTFAIVNIGRNGQNATQVANNAAGVAEVRNAWSAIIASRDDCYDVFPHLNYVPDPFVLDDLVVDADGAWVSGQAMQADGLHYTDEMFQAIGRTGARNLHTALGL